jgi:hypothetical protein
MTKSDNINIKIKEKFSYILYHWFLLKKNKLIDVYIWNIIVNLFEISKLNKPNEANFENWIKSLLNENQISKSLYNESYEKIKKLNLYLKDHRINEYRNKKIVHGDLKFNNNVLYIGPINKNGYIDSFHPIVKKYNNCRPLINYYIITSAIIACKQITNKIESTHSFYLNESDSLNEITIKLLLNKHKLRRKQTAEDLFNIVYDYYYNKISKIK